MPFIKTNDGTEIFYKDWGKGQPLVFSRGWPLSADDWDTQMLFFLSHDYRVIAHDRRSHVRLRPGAGMSIWRPAVRRASVDAEARAVPAANREQDAALGG